MSLSPSTSPDQAGNTARKRKLGHWILGETLGKGGYSWVKKGTHRKSSSTVALKCIHRSLNSKNEWLHSQFKQVQTEIHALTRLKHPNIIQLLAYNLNIKYPDTNIEPRDVVLFVLEYAAAGELFDILYYTGQLKPYIARTYFVQLLFAIDACHKAGIVHRDIKAQNMLLDAQYNLKLTDFGLAKIFKNPADIDTGLMCDWHVGTHGHQAPEILNRLPYTKTCDMFSMGVVLFILLTGYPPFEQASVGDVWYKCIIKKEYKKFWKLHRGCGIDSSAADLITRLIVYNPKRRLTIEKIRQHAWVRGGVLQGNKLANAMRMKYEKMELSRKGDPVKRGVLHGSVKKTVCK